MRLLVAVLLITSAGCTRRLPGSADVPAAEKYTPFAVEADLLAVGAVRQGDGGKLRVELLKRK